MAEKYTIADMVGFAANDDAASFKSAFDQIAGQRASDSIEAAREYVAQGFNSDNTDEEDYSDEEDQQQDEVDLEQ